MAFLIGLLFVVEMKDVDAQFQMIEHGSTVEENSQWISKLKRCGHVFSDHRVGTVLLHMLPLLTEQKQCVQDQAFES